MTSQPSSKPWDFTLVHRLINELTPEQPKDVEIIPRKSSDDPRGTGIGDLGPVWALLDKYKTQTTPFRELERLPIPEHARTKWETPIERTPARHSARETATFAAWDHDATAPQVADRASGASSYSAVLRAGLDAYASDGVAPRPKGRGVLWDSSDEEALFDDAKVEFFGNEASPAQKDNPKISRKIRKQVSKKTSQRQAVSDGEAVKPRTKAARPKMPAVRAASHQALKSESHSSKQDCAARIGDAHNVAAIRDQKSQTGIESQFAKETALLRKPLDGVRLQNDRQSSLRRSSQRNISSPLRRQITLKTQTSLSDTEAHTKTTAQIGTIPQRTTPKDGAHGTTIDIPVTLGARERSKSASTLQPFQKLGGKSRTSLIDCWRQRDRVERDINYRLKLIQLFPEDRLSLSQTVAFKQATEASIHVFIDFSNIWIGYMEHLKYLMGFSKYDRLTTQQRHLSFESLVFLLERGRHAEKRCLAGSWPWLPAFDTAKAIGYDNIILDKVQKNRDMTDEQRRLQSSYYDRSSDKPTDSAATSSLSGPGIMVPSKVMQSKPTAVSQQSPSSRPEKFVEQGVDELLQLKMSHSLLDYNTPSTIVLATGDGAQAEYSDGFLAMVERALTRGWKIELVSWKNCTNYIYFNRSWLQRWPAGQFRYIALESFVEYLSGSASE